MRKQSIITAGLFMAWIIATGLFVLPSQAKEIVDMKGNRVSVPDKIMKVYSGSPPLTYMIYAIDSSLLSGWNFRMKDEEKQYLDKSIHELPVLGGFYGQGNIANVEMILKTRPDVILLWADKDSNISKSIEGMMMKNIPVPSVNVMFEDIEDYGDAFLFLGRLLGREDRARTLKAYADEILEKAGDVLSKIPADQRPTVYYAEGTDGLNTDCDNSWHAELINVAGAKNVYHCEPKDTYGMEKINIEQVMIYDPDVILVQESDFFNKIFKDPRWQGMKAVKTKRIYLIPRRPFNWFDRPPSFMRLMGIQWLMNNFYPEEYNVDIVKKAKEFYSLFLGVDKTNEEIRKVIYP